MVVCRIHYRCRRVPVNDVNNHIAEHHLQTKHQIDWDSATCITYSTDYHQRLTLTLKMTTAQVVETSVTVNNNSPVQDYVYPDNQTQPTFETLD